MSCLTKIKQKNEGITLIEVIVSMLILAIITVPLLNTFVFSAKANAKARTRQYATTLAQNVMEGVKAYDLSDLALQFNNVSGNSLKIVPLTHLQTPLHGHGFYEASTQNDGFDVLVQSEANEEDMSIEFKNGEYVFRNTNRKIYHYVLKNVLEGTKRFDVQITYDGNDYTGNSDVNQNSFMLPNVSNLDINETALINPNGVYVKYVDIDDNGYDFLDKDKQIYNTTGSYSFDEKAINYFYILSSNYAYDQWMNACNQQRDEHPGVDITLPEPEEISFSDIEKRITRETVITISDQEGGYHVSCSIFYTYDQSDPLVPQITDSSIETVTKEYTGFYNVTFTELDNIYLFHVPYKSMVRYTEITDKVTIQNYSTNPDVLNVYIAEQPIGASFNSGDNIYVDAVTKDVFGNLQKDYRIMFYYENPEDTLDTKQLQAYDAYILGSSNYKKLLVESNVSKQRIYNVKVSVYEQGSTNVLYEIESTVTR